MSTFTLKIDLGNDQMSTRAHVAQALRCVAIGMRADETWDGTITDDNGYSVGRFELENPSAPVKRVRGDQLRELCWDIAASEYEDGKLALEDLPERVAGDGVALSMVEQWTNEDRLSEQGMDPASAAEVKEANAAEAAEPFGGRELP